MGLEFFIKCDHHKDRPAKYQADSWFKNGHNRHLCPECAKALQNAGGPSDPLNIQPIKAIKQKGA